MVVMLLAAIMSVVMAGFYMADEQKPGWLRVLAGMFILVTIIGGIVSWVAAVKARDPKANQATLKKLNLIAIICLIPAIIVAVINMGYISLLFFI